MTDHDLDTRMDARLTAAGERWRETNAEAPNNDVARRAVEADVRPSPRHRNRLLLVASAAVVAAALVAGAIVTLSQLGSSDQDAVGGKANLIGTVWKLDGDKSGSDATLYLGMDGRLVADDECTVIGAKVDARGTKLRATDIQTRHRDCTDQYGPRLGDDFAKALRTKPGYTAKQATLRIGDRHFVAAPELPRPTIDVPTWEEANWRLVRIKDASGKTVQFSKTIDLRVHDGVLSTSDGCNELSGEVGDRTGPVRTRDTTLVGCPAQRVIGPVLSAKFRASVRGSQLTIAKAGVGSLVYDWVPDDQSAIDVDRLVGPTWRLSGLAGDAPAGMATLRFPTATSYVANDGCREFSGSATVQDGTAALKGVPRSNAKSCPKSTRDQASTIDSFLAEGRWTIRDGKLLIDGGGSQAFSLVYVAGRSATVPDPLLLGTWTLTHFVLNGDEFGGRATLTIAATGYRTLTRCSDRSGTVVLDPSKGTLRLAEARHVDRKCAGGDPMGGDLGEGFANTYAVPTPYSVSNDRLVLRSKNLVLTFERR